ncbi:MAG: hypothetical protein GW886_02015 [Rhodobacterales bacterium]|nr:hypothetical protein [Rhodobacterales bacterium]
MIEQIGLFAIPRGIAPVTGLLTFLRAGAGQWRAALAVLVLPFVLLAWMVWLAETEGANGMAGLVVVVVLLLFVLPMLVGGAIGMAPGAWRRRQRLHHGTID